MPQEYPERIDLCPRSRKPELMCSQIKPELKLPHWNTSVQLKVIPVV